MKQHKPKGKVKQTNSKGRSRSRFKSEVRPRKAATSDQATAQSESVRPAIPNILVDGLGDLPKDVESITLNRGQWEIVIKRKKLEASTWSVWTGS